MPGSDRALAPRLNSTRDVTTMHSLRTAIRAELSLSRLSTLVTCIFLLSPARSQEISWVQDIDGVQGSNDAGGGLCVVDEGVSRVAYLLATVRGRTPEAQPAIPGQVFGLQARTADLLLRKVDSAGDTLWTVQYPASSPTSGSGATSVGAWGVAATTSQVFVTGNISNGALPGEVAFGGLDSFLACFSAIDGHLLWVEQFGTPAGEEALDIALGNGWVAICGSTLGDLIQDPDPKVSPSGYSDAYVGVWSFDGSLRWLEQYGSPMGGRATALAVDAGGTVCVVSDWSVEVAPGLLWRTDELRRFDDAGANGFVFRDRVEPGPVLTELEDVLAGPDGIYVVINSTNDSGRVQRLHSQTLAPLWGSRGVAVPSILYGKLALDGSSLYLAGPTLTGLNTPLETGSLLRMDALSGAIQSHQTFLVTAGFDPEAVVTMGSDVLALSTIDTDYLGNPVPDGTAISYESRDVFLTRIRSGELSVLQRIATHEPSTETAGSIGCDGNSYVSFSSDGQQGEAIPLGGRDVYVRKYGPGGATLWTRQIATDQEEVVGTLTTDDTSVYVSGLTRGGTFADEIASGAGPYAVFVCCYDFSGNRRWLRTFRYEQRDGVQVEDLAAAAGVLMFVGTCPVPIGGFPEANPGVQGSESFVIRLDAATGAVVWGRHLTAPTTLDDRTLCRGVCFDQESVYLCGSIGLGSTWPTQTSFGGNNDCFVACIDLATGQSMRWARQFGGSGDEIAFDVVQRADGIYVGGTSQRNFITNQVGPFAGFVRRYSTAGQLNGDWRVEPAPINPPSTGTFNTIIRALAADESGVYVCGPTSGLVGFPFAGGVSDAFIGKLGPVPGTISWLRQLGTKARDDAGGISVCESCVCVIGDTAGSFAEPNFPLSNNQLTSLVNGFIARINLDAPPVANAGPDIAAHCGQPALLDGRGSVDDNTSDQDLVFVWTLLSKPVGSATGVVAADQPQAGLVPDMPGDYVVQLTVYDSLGQSSSDTAVVSSSNLPPAAEIRATRLTYLGQAIVLDGSASADPDADPITYRWSVVQAPAGSAVAIVDAQLVNARFTPDLTGQYTIGLVVADSCSVSPMATVDITIVTPQNYAVQQIVAAQAIAASLTPTQWTNPGHAHFYSDPLGDAALAIADSDPATDGTPILQQAIRRCDGFPLRNALDTSGNDKDWIADEAAQRAIYALLMDALAAIYP